MLSIIIPARNEIYLQRTIEDIIKNAEGEYEIIAVLDGYWADPPIKDHPRVKLIHHTESIGQRQSINEAAKIAQGKYIMKCDAHCAFDKGFDVKLAKDCKYEWTVVPRMYNLDHKTWKPKLHKRTDYMYIGNKKGRELRAEYYGSAQPKNDKMIDDTMCCMGPCFFMHKDRFWELDGCDEGHGGWGQQGVEVSLKAWLSGGALKVNKKTWFSHWFRGGGGPGFPYPITGRDVSKARDYSRELWFNNKWEKQTRTLEWLVKKFNPPTWRKILDKNFATDYYEYMLDGHRMPYWRGTKVVKYPNDLILYQEKIFENRPDFIVETGTYKGGSSLFMADVCELIGHGHVITIDLKDHNPPKHKRITHLIGRSTDKDTLAKVRDLVGDKSVMVVLDSNHHRSHVKRELVKYGEIVTKGQFMIVEDTNYAKIGRKNGPKEAVDWYMKRTRKFKVEHPEEKYFLSLCPGGWLKRL